MPVNLGQTLFASWLTQQQADRAQRREDERYNSERLEKGARLNRIQGEIDRKQAEAEAQARAAQNEALTPGAEQPTYEDPGMAQAQKFGVGQAILAAREKAQVAKAARAKQDFEMNKYTLGLGNAEDIEREKEASGQKIAQGNNAAAIRVAEINANRPQGIGRGMQFLLKATYDTQNLKGALGDLEGAAKNPATGQVDYTQFQGVGPTVAKWGEKGLARIGALGLLPQDVSDDYARRTAFVAVKNRIRAMDIHNFAGSAQTKYEMKNLQDAILGDDGADPIQFASTVNQLVRLADRQERIMSSLYATGQYHEGSPEFDAAVAQEEQRNALPPTVGASTPQATKPSNVPDGYVRYTNGSEYRWAPPGTAPQGWRAVQ